MAGDATNATLTNLPADRYMVLQQLGKNAGGQTYWRRIIKWTK